MATGTRLWYKRCLHLLITGTFRKVKGYTAVLHIIPELLIV